MREQYIINPDEAMERGLPILYVEPATERVVVMLTPSLMAELETELERDRRRYTVNNRMSLAEVQRAALQVYLRLREHDPKLFFLLRDCSISRMNATEELEWIA